MQPKINFHEKYNKNNEEIDNQLREKEKNGKRNLEKAE